MRIRIIRFKDFVIVELAGRLVLGDETTLFRAEMDGVIGQYGRIILNMDGLNKVDCAGLGELVRCEALARNAGKTIVVEGFTRRISDLLTITRLATLFPFGGRDIPKAA